MSEIAVAVTIVLVAALASLALTLGVRSYALRTRLLDVPNTRSSHVLPTPKGGGLAIVVVVCLGVAVLAAAGRFDIRAAAAIVPAALAVAWLGFIDDRRNLNPAVRLVAQFGAAILYLIVVKGPPALGVAWVEYSIAIAFALTVLGLVWLLNLFNFMDGIDGIAGTELVFVSLALALLTFLSGHGHSAMWLALLLAAAGMGFLAFNWPPASIFMGDVGSGFSGFLLGVLSLQAIRDTGITLWVPAILLAAFVTDATVTLIRRALRGERLYEAHRCHAYQWLSRRWGSHRPVVLVLLAVNGLWLLPLALWAQWQPAYAAIIGAIAYGPLAVLAWWGRAGESDRGAKALSSGH